MISSYLLAGGLRVHYLHLNLDGGRPPVLLLHGVARSARHWEQVGAHLAGAGLAVYAIDERGHGLTDTPEGDFSLEAFQADLLSFCNTLDIERPVLVGHSWGAMLALAYAARFQAGPRAPAAVALVDGALSQFSDYLSEEEMSALFYPPSEPERLKLDDYLAQLTRPGQKWQPDEAAVQAFLADIEVAEDETVTPRVSPDRQIEMMRQVWAFPAYALMDRLRCPAVAVMARFPEPYSQAEKISMAAKAAGAARFAQLPGCRVEWLADTVHHIPLQRPDDLGRILVDFLRAALPTSANAGD